MKIIDIIKRIFKRINPTDELLEFISKIDFTDIVEEEIDNEVKHAINNNLTTFGLDHDKILNKCTVRAYNRINTKLEKSNYNSRKLTSLKSVLDINLVSSCIMNNVPIDDDKIINSYQKFIDANAERIRLEDEEAAKSLKDQYEDVDTLPEAVLMNASSYEDPYFKTYGETDEEIIPPVDEESDIIEDDGSIEILEYPDYESVSDEEDDIKDEE